MTKRDMVKCVLDHKTPPYVPWSYWFTVEAHEKLAKHYGTDDVITAVDNHMIDLGCEVLLVEDIGGGKVRDNFDVVWDRTIDKDIGTVAGCALPEPTLKNFEFPDPLDPRFFQDIPDRLERYGGCFRVFQLGFTFFERAWTLRGMENLLIDFCDHPRFVMELFEGIADYTIAQIEEALKYDIDGFYFGDDWGQQHGLIMGPNHWRKFIYPGLKRMFIIVRGAGKYVFLHSCGDVDELFDDLIEMGLHCFNPFQPEVMDVGSLIKRYRSQLSFHGGLSLQNTLPFGTVDDVRKETRQLIEWGSEGGFILSPSHAVEGDVPLENMLAFIECAMEQDGYAECPV